MWRGGNFSPHELFLLEQKKGQVKNNGEHLCISMNANAASASFHPLS
jgi:hypothetical protein